MQALIFCGIQASGKSTFYCQQLLNSHVHISLDLLHTRHRERLLLQLCLATQARFVVDNTNPTAGTLPATSGRRILPATNGRAPWGWGPMAPCEASCGASGTRPSPSEGVNCSSSRAKSR